MDVKRPRVAVGYEVSTFCVSFAAPFFFFYPPLRWLGWRQKENFQTFAPKREPAKIRVEKLFKKRREIQEMCVYIYEFFEARGFFDG